jgi:ATPase subunit of ABC transporter with duplicated ATPase domains
MPQPLARGSIPVRPKTAPTDEIFEMASLTVSNLAARAGDTLFHDISFSLSSGDRLGLVAGNGAGKSTLLRILAGEAEASAGTVTPSRGLTLAYVTQDLPERLRDMSMHRAVLDALPPDVREAESWHADIALADLGVPEDFHHLQLNRLSGGWQRMTLLARAAVLDPDLMLLDEPTNHLDLERILGLERWLAGQGRGRMLVIASHDRRFLDATTNRTLFLRPGESVGFALPYGAARDALAERDAADVRAQARDLKEAQRLRRNAQELYNVGVNSGSDLLQTKARQLKARAAAIETAQKELHRDRSGVIALASRDTHARVVLALENLDVTVPDGRVLFRVPKLHIFAGDRVVLLGANGAGKTRLMTALADALRGETVPGIRVAGSLVAGIADQALSHVPDAQTPFAWLTGSFDVPDQRARALLAGAGIEVLKQDRPISALSFGQKSRLGMLGLRLTRPSLYLLDEPTNHLDIAGQEALEAEIVEQGASVVMVSHDRAFTESIATRWLWIFRGRLTEVDGPEAFYAGLGGAG